MAVWCLAACQVKPRYWGKKTTVQKYMSDEQREWKGISWMLTCSGKAKCNGMKLKNNKIWTKYQRISQKPRDSVQQVIFKWKMNNEVLPNRALET